MYIVSHTESWMIDNFLVVTIKSLVFWSPQKHKQTFLNTSYVHKEKI